MLRNILKITLKLRSTWLFLWVGLLLFLSGIKELGSKVKNCLIFSTAFTVVLLLGLLECRAQA